MGRCDSDRDPSFSATENPTVVMRLRIDETNFRPPALNLRDVLELGIANGRLKKIVADLTLANAMPKEVARETLVELAFK
jgi:hypothetical protein